MQTCFSPSSALLLGGGTPRNWYEMSVSQVREITAGSELLGCVAMGGYVSTFKMELSTFNFRQGVWRGCKEWSLCPWGNRLQRTARLTKTGISLNSISHSHGPRQWDFWARQNIVPAPEGVSCSCRLLCYHWSSWLCSRTSWPAVPDAVKLHPVAAAARSLKLNLWEAGSLFPLHTFPYVSYHAAHIVARALWCCCDLYCWKGLCSIQINSLQKTC